MRTPGRVRVSSSLRDDKQKRTETEGLYSGGGGEVASRCGSWALEKEAIVAGV
jgi:hypothetical protein